MISGQTETEFASVTVSVSCGHPDGLVQWFDLSHASIPANLPPMGSTPLLVAEMDRCFAALRSRLSSPDFAANGATLTALTKKAGGRTVDDNYGAFGCFLARWGHYEAPISVDVRLQRSDAGSRLSLSVEVQVTGTGLVDDLAAAALARPILSQLREA